MIEKVKLSMLCMAKQCWEAGIAAQALWELSDMETLNIAVYDMVLRQSQDGRLCNVEDTPAVTDSAFCIPSVWALSEYNRTETENEGNWADTNEALYRAQDLKDAVQRNIDFLLYDADRASDGTLYHMRGTSDIWADSAAFLPFSMILLGHTREGLNQLGGITDRLFDPESALFFHMWNEEKGAHTRKVLWGIGNGWILTGTLRCYCELVRQYPEEAQYGEEKEKLRHEFLRLLNIMVKYLSPHFLLRDVMDDPGSFEESEASAMLAYSIYRGFAAGLVDREMLATADKIRTSLIQKTDVHGIVRGAASSPHFIKPGTSAECQAHFLMMEAARNN